MLQVDDCSWIATAAAFRSCQGFGQTAKEAVADLRQKLQGLVDQQQRPPPENGQHG